MRSGDSLDTLREKVRIATVLGTLQSTLTDFRYLSKKWKDNTEEERLLGVSLTGIMDHPMLNGSYYNEDKELDSWLKELREVAVDTNKQLSHHLGIPQSTAITCVNV